MYIIPLELLRHFRPDRKVANSENVISVILVQIFWQKSKILSFEAKKWICLGVTSCRQKVAKKNSSFYWSVRRLDFKPPSTKLLKKTPTKTKTKKVQIFTVTQLIKAANFSLIIERHND